MLSSLIAVIFIIVLNGRNTLQGELLQCGVRQAVKNQLIIGGDDTKPGAWPWHAAIYHTKWISQDYVCGGTLISAQFVLTAAHCLVNPENKYQLPPERIAVRLGVHNLKDLSTQQEHQIHKIYNPDEFNSNDIRNDIAILELYTLATFNDYVQPACLGIYSNLTGTYGTVVGWGAAEDDKISPILKSVRMPVIDHITCLKSNRDLFGKTLDETTLCAGYTTGTTVCNGDSGGGLFFHIGNAWYLGGIVSYAQERDDGTNLCHTNSYGAFTNVVSYLPWISRIAKLNLQRSSETVSTDYSQNATCITPQGKSGTCIAVERCRNIYSFIIDPSPQTPYIRDYITRAACTLRNVQRSVCCQPKQIAPVSSMMSTAATTTYWTHPNLLNLLPRDCGSCWVAAEEPEHESTTQTFEYPWMAVLRYDYNGIIMDGCGGSLINKRYILTAAHCVKTMSTMPLHSVVLGEHTKNQEEDCIIYKNEHGRETERDCAYPVEIFGIESFVVHPNYNRPRYRNDIALIRLDNDVVMTEHIRPICLPVTSALQNASLERYILTGWGTTEQSIGSDRLLKANLSYVSNSECQRKMNENRLNIRLSNQQMCASGIDIADTCKGDSGGPLGFKSSLYGGRFTQFGIVALGMNSCGTKRVPGIYSRVASYMDWILDNMKA